MCLGTDDFLKVLKKQGIKDEKHNDNFCVSFVEKFGRRFSPLISTHVENPCVALSYSSLDAHNRHRASIVVHV